MARLPFAVDFDGTITQRDTLHVTAEEVMEREFAEVRADHFHRVAARLEGRPAGMRLSA